MMLIVAVIALMASSALGLSSPQQQQQQTRRQFWCGSVAIVSSPQLAWAAGDEIFDGGKCAKRGVLGKCLSYDDDDMERSENEMESPTARARLLPREEVSSSPLMDRLREQTETNRLKNERQVQLDSFANSQPGLFGPLSRYEPVEKVDGQFVLVPARDYESLKKAKRIVSRRFVSKEDSDPYDKVVSK